MMSFMIILMTFIKIMIMATMAMTVDDDGVHVGLYTEAVFA